MFGGCRWLHSLAGEQFISVAHHLIAATPGHHAANIDTNGENQKNPTPTVPVQRDFGPMLKAERRALYEGKVVADDADWEQVCSSSVHSSVQCKQPSIQLTGKFEMCQPMPCPLGHV